MFLPGKMLVEQKSAGKDLARAKTQALSYLDGIDDHDLPRIVVTSDFSQFEVFDLESRRVEKFPLEELPERIKAFACLIGEAADTYVEQTPVNRQAAEQMAALHVTLENSGYRGHKLAVFLVRVVFCLFADDSGIFDRDSFSKYLRTRTAEDGSDTGPRLAKLFEVLDTSPNERSRLLDEELATFPYVNGGIFKEILTVPDFDAQARSVLIQASRLDWRAVSPAIFGAMFQGVMDEAQRHDLGAHYTSEENILKLIKPLFLDDLYAEYGRANSLSRRVDRNRALDRLHDKLAGLKFLDPACGCGNFLVIAYRELRRLEHRIVSSTLGGTTLVDVRELLRVRVEQFSGIELEEFPAQIAKTAMWLTDHQMNREASATLGTHFVRLPLTEGAKIVCADALELDWESICPASELSFVMGNPPFLGSRMMSATQKAQVRRIAVGYKQAGFLDYVSAWYIKAEEIMEKNPDVSCAFVSTNSISQGEQPGILWKVLGSNGTRIRFAHRTFRWRNSARGVAAVHCVIVGFDRHKLKERELYYYPDLAEEPILKRVAEISPYLVPGPDYVVANRQRQISHAPSMAFGNMAADGGHLFLSASERESLLAEFPETRPWILPAFGAREFIQGTRRYCLWLEGIGPEELRAVPPVRERVARVREVRLGSARPELADAPHLFAQRTQRAREPFLLIPRVSSEAREYVPMGFFGPGVIATDACMVVEKADEGLFALMTSRLHMDWLRTVGGRLKSDLRYSKDVVYNNFVMPDMDTEAQKKLVLLGKQILAARAQHPTASLAALYDPVTMPRELRLAHRMVDIFVDRLYNLQPGVSADARVSMLLTLSKAKSADAGGLKY